MFAAAPRHNPIDEKNLAKLAALRIPPSPDAGDAAFLRRAYLDATGTLPTAEQVEAFLEDHDPDRRARLVDRLLESPEYVDYWAYKWSDMLLVSSRKLPGPSMWSFYRFVRRERGEERPVGPVRPLDPDGAGEHAIQRRRPRSTCCTATRST